MGGLVFHAVGVRQVLRVAREATIARYFGILFCLVIVLYFLSFIPLEFDRLNCFILPMMIYFLIQGANESLRSRRLVLRGLAVVFVAFVSLVGTGYFLRKVEGEFRLRNTWFFQEASNVLQSTLQRAYDLKTENGGRVNPVIVVHSDFFRTANWQLSVTEEDNPLK